ncbi:hypothetical protein CORT_0C02180 [Candida orthopsilosis Co 90-125]|uniref:Fe2OG dioxygenase domain-containing protein n=1 Tax=Candida orthopsilosis (strain 90-125) TaxID=1136231 RepID=H8X2P7_CANO9|nr:hypothetical protein CORT_0C02180 [Candida orthopsilosis Co 90-125]CCG25594.1 hypothetical protein CORT_0C02180 [Candida orthopsilosis Co 90-125]
MATVATTAIPNYQDILDGNIHKRVPLDTYVSQLEPIYKSIPTKSPTAPTPTSAPYSITPINPKFYPLVHLQYYANGSSGQEQYNNTRRLTLEQLGLSNPQMQISPIGVSDPFPLFTDEAIDIMRSELLARENFMKYARYCHSSTSGMDCVVRGYVKDNEGNVNCEFIHDAWTHPATMELVSKMAGVDLEIVIDFEIAHANISMKTPEEADAEIAKHEEAKEEERVKERKVSTSSSRHGDDIRAVVGWHHDSYPFVCVLMLSDTTNMIGGETSLRMGKTKAEVEQEIAIVPSPKQGSACVLQGRLIEHIAPAPQGLSERITMVTSFRARDPSLPDTSVLDTVKPEVNFGSRYHEFYQQWVNYRCDLVKQKLDLIKSGAMVEEGDSGKKVFDKKKMVEQLKSLEEYIKTTYEEMLC